MNTQTTPPSLTPRQRSVLGCLLRGCSNKAIARDLAVAEGTVKIHVAAILRELHAHNRTEAVIRALDLGLRA
jgi:two-component system, NarL family, nitrate/nitrite response regulator NarL